MAEVLHEGDAASRIKEEEEYSPGFSSEDYDQADDLNNQESPTESKLGNSILDAANRVNRLLIAGVELRGDIKQSAETTMIAAKEKITKVGKSALFATEAVIGFGVSGAEAIGTGVNKIKDKAKEKAQDFIGEAKLEYTDFKDTIEFGKNDIKESFNNAKAHVGEKVNNIKDGVSDKAEAVRSFTSEKVKSIRDLFQQKRSEAVQRKEQRTKNHEQIKLTREQNKVENEQPENEQPDVYTSPEGKSILEATKTPENKKSILGNTVMSAAERINNALISGTEKREAMIGTAKEKVKKIGNSALFATDVVIGFGVTGKEVISQNAKDLQEKAVNVAHSTIDNIGSAYGEAKKQVGDKVDHVKDTIFDKAETVKDLASEKIKNMRETFKQKRFDAEQRKKARKEALAQLVKRFQVTGHTAREAWKNYKPETSNV